MDDDSCSSSGIKPKRRSVKGKWYYIANALIIPGIQDVCVKFEVVLPMSILLGE